MKDGHTRRPSVAVMLLLLLLIGLVNLVRGSAHLLLLGYVLKPPVGPPPGLLPDLGTLFLAVAGLAVLALAGVRLTPSTNW